MVSETVVLYNIRQANGPTTGGTRERVRGNQSKCNVGFLRFQVVQKKTTSPLAQDLEVTSSPLEDFYTPPAVARMLGVSTPTVYLAVRREDGGMSHIRTPGNQIRIRGRDVYAYCHDAGLKVPPGLTPDPADVLVIHRSRTRARRIRKILGPRCNTVIETDPVVGLLRLGAMRPPLSLVSIELGIPFIARLSDAIKEGGVESYTALVVLQKKPNHLWDGGPVPIPLPIGEPTSTSHSNLQSAAYQLLGFNTRDS